MSESDPAPPEKSSRFEAVDLFRGMTVAAMLLVNNPGSWAHVFPPLAHAEWHGWTPTDLIFPFFLFIVGITTHLSLSQRQARGDERRALMGKVWRRAMAIVLLGLALNAFPFYSWGTIAGIDDPTPLQRIVRRFDTLRFSGVLQRIGVVYLFTAMAMIYLRRRTIAFLAAMILVAYWGAMTLIPVPPHALRGALVLDQPEKTLAAYFDRLILGEQHIYKAAKTWDPEGPLSTLPATATALLGLLAGGVVIDRDSQRRLITLFAWGALATTAGLCWNWLFPINKNLWTSSYVIFTAGVAALTLAISFWLYERGVAQRLAPFFVPFGTNPMIAFVGSGVMARLTDSLIRVPSHGKQVTLHNAFYQPVLASWLEPRLASLAYALLFVIFWWLILFALHQKRIYWRV